jgi:hypothetical protein
MSVFIFQFIIKQWDKGQNTPPHQTARAAIPSAYAVNTKPAFEVFNQPCILEQHGDDIPTNIYSDGRIRTTVLSEDRVMFDRFQLINTGNGLELEYLKEGSKNQSLGQLNNHWIKAQYQWRYRVIENKQLYWMYENVTLNAACLQKFDAECFLKTEPSIVFNDR